MEPRYIKEERFVVSGRDSDLPAVCRLIVLQLLVVVDNDGVLFSLELNQTGTTLSAPETSCCVGWTSQRDTTEIMTC